jgi:hypothetical protein
MPDSQNVPLWMWPARQVFHDSGVFGGDVLELLLYQNARTHLALAEDAPEPRAVDRPENGRIVAIPQVGGLHHTNGALLNRPFATPYSVRFCALASTPPVLSFPAKSKLSHPCGGPFGAMNRPAEFHRRFLSVPVI